MRFETNGRRLTFLIASITGCFDRRDGGGTIYLAEHDKLIELF
jgi:hypothetical protein